MVPIEIEEEDRQATLSADAGLNLKSYNGNEVEYTQLHVAQESADPLDVPIVKGPGLSCSFSDSSEPIAPVLDRETGLFSIKPKYIKSSKILSPWNLRIKLGKQPRVNSKPCVDATKSSKPSTSSESQHSVSNDSIGKNSASPSPFGFSAEDEAEATLKVATTLGFSFIASKEEVLHRFRSIEEEN
ncbi:hypothetical protein V6N13_147338 [Hibiscus sabdariffa]